MEEEKQMEIADELAEVERASGINNARKALAPQHHEDFDGKHCLDCGVEVPKERLEAKRIRCTYCESVVETKKKRGW